MALEGSLRDFDLFSLFNMIKIQGKNGTLVLSQGQEFVKVFFENGEIVGCDSNQVRMEDRLGTMLVRLGRLTGDELLAMVQVQRQTLKRMGTLLLESGKVNPSDLQDALFNQATSILHRTFRWVEGDYRFDSMLPPDLDRDHFVPIPVDTVLMEAARIQDEWPEVERRLPGMDTPLGKSPRAQALHLDIDRDVSSLLDGKGGQMQHGSSGLTHEQEMVLSYFDHAQCIKDIVQVSRYEELDTCKAIADLLEAGLLEPITGEAPKVVRPWVLDGHPDLTPQEWESNRFLWPMVAVGFLVPLALYVPHHRGSMNMGLASLQPVDVLVVPEGPTRLRQAWALRMASPGDGGVALAKHLGRPLDGANPVPDLAKLPDPMAPPIPAPEPAPVRKNR
ncbi:hypothetical protein GETHLI_08940 [Geothrix limicola]|uniref:PatA-like N-terminal domain-containing protein n=1 Tax=Geothrix limicola TaxID=2927978 RepID=A0ABQ5QCL9_9BACT|nr:DUF4388 domain-containing protein [Geothrix limicola]GLH72392.1 hypothetical protein GETHLI_08940 [Geothrix limicola]